ncbi:putative SCO-spondin-like [Apostichopus japonicus]|uniref:Putative SCO-spondin-like n=1 Tax=Stichopus japonicus TaxID=307972 RepID=A0A2G8LNE8_STIJA|nr:putative SCO-spondin-like [Apostichopus japonicus]
MLDESNEDLTERTVHFGCGFGTHFDDEDPTQPGFNFPHKAIHCSLGVWNDSTPSCIIPYNMYLYTLETMNYRNVVVWQGDQLQIDFFTKGKSLILKGPYVYKESGEKLENSTLTKYIVKPRGVYSFRAEWRGYPTVEDTGYYYYLDTEKYWDDSEKKWMPRKRYEYFYVQVYGPIDGQWSEWTAWSSCDSTCGDSSRFRSHSCDNPAPENGGDYCPGPWNETEICNVDPCPVDGNWAPWSAWWTCTKSCGGGSQTHTRTCTNPAPVWGGLDCGGESEETTGCNTNPCPIDGGWGSWDDWSACTVQCGGGGTRQRIRYCDDPSPEYGGDYCVGDSYETESCGEQSCKVDGNWAQWSSWNECSVTCGFGVTSRNRTCSDPSPTSGGRDCPGHLIVNNYYQAEDCMELLECPVDGGWTEWPPWTNCSELCGGGFQFRNRSCSNPPPSSDGADCHGNTTETRECNVQPCGDGGWTEWSPWSICSASCLGGVQARSRSCTNPRPGPNGLDCPAKDPISQWRRCNQQPCPVHGRWGQWTNWTSCSASCDGGFRWRNRNCSNPAPLWGGDECRGKELQRKRCSSHLCPVFALTEGIEFIPFDTHINASWSQPLDYVWPILYYNVHIRLQTSKRNSDKTILYNKADGYHYTIYNLSDFKTYATRDNDTFTISLPFLQPFSSYELCISTKYNHTQESLHSELVTVTTLKYAYPAPPTDVRIELADFELEREHKVLIRWTPNPSEDYAEPTGYQVMIRDIRTPWNQGWRTLANVTEEITGV